MAAGAEINIFKVTAPGLKPGARLQTSAGNNIKESIWESSELFGVNLELLDSRDVFSRVEIASSLPSR